MFRNQYDNDITTFSPQGRLHQVEYAMEAVKQGSACVGLRSKTHVVLLALQRRLGGELASYQKKLLKLDDHIGVAFAGLFSDARVLTNYMRTECLRHKLLFDRHLPSLRLVSQVADKAQTNTQEYGLRPYGVGFLVAAMDDLPMNVNALPTSNQGSGSMVGSSMAIPMEALPHLYEISPSANVMEYQAHAIGARSQSARTYLEKYGSEFMQCNEQDLIVHGLEALKHTLQSDKTLTKENVAIAVVDAKRGYRYLSSQEIEQYLQQVSETSSGSSSSSSSSSGDATTEQQQQQQQSGVEEEDDRGVPMEME